MDIGIRNGNKGDSLRFSASAQLALISFFRPAFPFYGRVKTQSELPAWSSFQSGAPNRLANSLPLCVQRLLLVPFRRPELSRERLKRHDVSGLPTLVAGMTVNRNVDSVILISETAPFPAHSNLIVTFPFPRGMIERYMLPTCHS